MNRLTGVDFKTDNGKLIIYISGEIDHHSAMKIKDSIDAQILNVMPRTAVMNFENVSFMDSSGIGLILARYRFCQNTGTSLYVEGVNRQTQKILALAGIKTINDVAI
ncbi:MAG: anti-sigma factor antagonist [Oscillospiraceae bacterium]|nr:anti-sigma factor antagonist [Oscillospiraceae bacterium]